jgi:hypothetical protein
MMGRCSERNTVPEHRSRPQCGESLSLRSVARGVLSSHACTRTMPITGDTITTNSRGASCTPIHREIDAILKVLRSSLYQISAGRLQTSVEEIRLIVRV